jgi:formate/nitrite transporter FocA (FNT family)
MSFLDILGAVSLIAGITSSIVTIVSFFASQNPSTKQKLMLVGVPLAIILIIAGAASLFYSSQLAISMPCCQSVVQ